MSGTIRSLEESGDELELSLVLKRRIINSMTTTFVPSALIGIICHVTVYFGGHLFKAVVVVNLTSLLCLITMFINNFDTLLRTSYLKVA